MKIFDSHIHIFTKKVVCNVQQNKRLVERLKLQTKGAEARVNLETLEAEMETTDVSAALMLPTANVGGVSKTNRDCVAMAARSNRLMTAGTLHPDYFDIEQELVYLSNHNVRFIKLCSFSQGFRLNGPAALKMFNTIEMTNKKSLAPFSVVLDTLVTADTYFGTRPEYTTTPKLLGEIAGRYPGINFIGAHMGGLDAPFEDISRYLKPRPNLYLDTSNAAHVLTKDDFVHVLKRHGSRHVLFGTDWPWFTHEKEVPYINRLLDMAKFSGKEKKDVFSCNLARLLGMT